MKKIIGIVVILLFLLLPVPALTAGKTPTVSASRTKNKLAINVNFSNLTNTKKIKYQLTYGSTGGAQGVSGTLSPRTARLSRQLLLGTCSKKVCVYHKGVNNIRLNIDFTLKTGGIISYSKKL